MYQIWQGETTCPHFLDEKPCKKLPFKILSSYLIYLYPFLCVEQAFSTFTCWCFYVGSQHPPRWIPQLNQPIRKKSEDYRSDNSKHNWVIKLILEDVMAFLFYLPILKEIKSLKISTQSLLKRPVAAASLLSTASWLRRFWCHAFVAKFQRLLCKLTWHFGSIMVIRIRQNESHTIHVWYTLAFKDPKMCVL